MSKSKDPKQKYVSLTGMIGYSGYSQEYLSLRARQGKLKAIKLGRNWVTTKKWIDDYLKKTNDYKNNKNKNKIKLSDRTKIKEKREKIKELRGRQDLKELKELKGRKEEKAEKTERIERVEVELEELRKEIKEELKEQELKELREIKELKELQELKDRKEERAERTREKKREEIEKISFAVPPVRKARVIAIVCALVFILFSVGAIFSYPYILPSIKSTKDFVVDTCREFPLLIYDGMGNIGEKIKTLNNKIFENTGEILVRVQGLSSIQKRIKNIFYNLGYNLAFYLSYDMQGIEKIESMKKMGDMEKIVRETFCDNLARSRQIVTNFWRDVKGIVGNIKGDIIGNIKGNIKGIGNIKGNVKETLNYEIEKILFLV